MNSSGATRGSGRSDGRDGGGGGSGGAAGKAVKAVLDSILDGVERDGSVSIAGFGTFERKERAARTGRNPRTGESLEIPASITVGFRPAAALKRTAVDA